MNHFLDTIRSALSTGQRQVLSRYLQEVAARRAPGTPQEIEQALALVGEFLPAPNLDVTTVEGYNAWVRTALADLAGLYQEIDNLESVQDGLDLLNRTELDRVEIALRDLGTLVSQTKTANAASIQWSDVFFESFGAEVGREEDREWYRPLPQLEVSGFVESYIPLYVDPSDRALKLQPGGDFSRSTSPAGDPLAQVEVEELLGFSADPTHGIDQAVDGKYFTYWRELSLSDAPIEADPLQVPWLPPTYESGAAARIHFRFPFAVPFSELALRPFARYPIQALQVIWDNRKRAVNNRVLNGTFSSGATAWTTTASVGTTVTYPSVGGYNNGSYANVAAPSGRAYLVNNDFISSGTAFAYHLVAKLQRTRVMDVEFQVHWKDNAGNILRIDRDLPTTPRDEWFEYSKLYNAPSGWTTTDRAAVALIADGSGSVQFTDVSFSAALGFENKIAQIDPEADTLHIQTDTSVATDIWLVVAQPHYEYLQVSLPEGDLSQGEVWENILLAAEGKSAEILRLSKTSWSLEKGELGIPQPRIDPNESPLMREIYRLGGRIREMMVGLLQYARPSTRTRSVSRYLYLLGAWEIEIRHREYSPQGLFVSKPYAPRGEVREVTLVTNPPLRTLTDRVRFWLTARESDRLDKAKRFFGRATFTSTTESAPANAAETHFSLPPLLKVESFNGTDRNGRVTLTHYPYVNRERIWTVQAALASGAIGEPTRFDPNKELVTSVSGGVIRTMTGYRPLKVTLLFPNGTVARPDVLGKLQEGDIAFSGPDLLDEATVEQEISLLSESAQRRVNQQLQRVQPAQRERLRDRLLQQELNRLQVSATPDTRKLTQKIPVNALRTRNRRIVSSQNGVNLTLYWHKGGDDLTVGALQTSGDILISPSKYTVDAERGVVIVRDRPPNGNRAYNSFIAYYYYRQSDDGSRTLQESRSSASLPTTGIDSGGYLTQPLPITRNMTDHVFGGVEQLRPAVLDELDPGYYPVYEYIQDERGRLVFGNNLFRFGDTPAQVLVEYESLALAPRLLIEVRKASLNDYSSRSPIINDLALYMSSRR
jgi:hypothetical protein